MILIRTPYEDCEDTAERQPARLGLPVSPLLAAAMAAERAGAEARRRLA